MENFKDIKKEYFNELKKRSSQTGAHHVHQFVGLQIAVILDDWKHRALYMRLAKKQRGDTLLQLAKSVAEKKNVKNKGAYFMSMFRAPNNPPRDT